jgi:hypothetical protein
MNKRKMLIFPLNGVRLYMQGSFSWFMVNVTYRSKSILLTPMIMAVLIGVTVTAAYGQASVSTIQFSSPIGGQVSNFCGLEDVQLSGSVNNVLHITRDANGGLHIIDGHTNFQGVTGVGLTSGSRYIFAGGVNPISNVVQDSANSITFLAHGRLISPGQQTNQLATTQIHVTFNANGQVTSQVENFVFECR